MNLTELENLAKAVYSPTKDNWEMRHAFAAFNKEANPQTILAMIELMKEMGECLLHCYAETDARINKRAEILAKYKEMTK
jgi:hypothetical protein